MAKQMTEAKLRKALEALELCLSGTELDPNVRAVDREQLVASSDTLRRLHRSMLDASRVLQ